MTLQWSGGLPLIIDGKMAMDPNCCCEDAGCCCLNMQAVTACEITVSGIIDQGDGGGWYFYDCDCDQWNTTFIVPRDEHDPDIAPWACQGSKQFFYTCLIKSTGEEISMSVTLDWRVYCCWAAPPDYLFENCAMIISMQITPALYNYIRVEGEGDLGTEAGVDQCLGASVTTDPIYNTFSGFGTSPDCDIFDVVFHGTLI